MSNRSRSTTPYQVPSKFKKRRDERMADEEGAAAYPQDGAAAFPEAGAVGPAVAPPGGGGQGGGQPPQGPQDAAALMRRNQQLQRQLDEAHGNIDLIHRQQVLREEVIIDDLRQRIQSIEAGRPQQPRGPRPENDEEDPDPVPRNPGLRFQFFNNDGTVTWFQFRRHFESLCKIYQYSTKMSKAYLAGSMVGPASDVVSTINPEDYVTLRAMLDAYQERFMGPAAKTMAKTQYEVAKQEKDESLLAFHNRIRQLYQNAYPERGEQWRQDQDLIKRFVLGIRDKGCRVTTNIFVTMNQTASYDDVLVMAQNLVSVTHQEEFYHRHDGRRTNTADFFNVAVLHDAQGVVEDQEGISTLKSFGKPAYSATRRAHNKQCLWCKEIGHFKEDCEKFLLKKFKEMFGDYPQSKPHNKPVQNTNSNRGNNFRGRGGYSAGNSRGNNSQRGGRSRGGGWSSGKISQIEEDDNQNSGQGEQAEEENPSDAQWEEGDQQDFQ